MPFEIQSSDQWFSLEKQFVFFSDESEKTKVCERRINLQIASTVKWKWKIICFTLVENSINKSNLCISMWHNQKETSVIHLYTNANVHFARPIQSAFIIFIFQNSNGYFYFFYVLRGKCHACYSILWNKKKKKAKIQLQTMMTMMMRTEQWAMSMAKNSPNSKWIYFIFGAFFFFKWKKIVQFD